jgi:hypothetical protein
MVDEEAQDRDAFIHRIKEERKYSEADMEEFLEELDEVKMWTEETTKMSQAIVAPWVGSNSCYCVRQRSLQRFWTEAVGVHCISVTPTEFIDATRAYFEMLYYMDILSPGDDVIIASLLEEVLPRVLDAISKDPAYPECIDFFSFAKYIRSLPFQDLPISSFQKLVASVAEGGICLLPPPHHPIALPVIKSQE